RRGTTSRSVSLHAAARAERGRFSMANRTKVTQQKRARERAKQERQQEKTRRREEAKVRKANEPRQSGDEDPDIAGIIPGPQPSPWGDDDLVGDDEVEK